MLEEMSTGCPVAPFGGFGGFGFGGFSTLPACRVGVPAAAPPDDAAAVDTGAARPITSTTPAATAIPRTVRPRRNIIDITCPLVTVERRRLAPPPPTQSTWLG